MYIIQIMPLLFISLMQLADGSFDIPEYDLPGFPEGYVYYSGMGYYKMHTDGKTWFEAERACNSEGAHLAIVNSNSESLILSDIFSKHENLNLALIGFHDIYKEGEYLAVNGVQLENTGYAVWDNGEPNNKENGNEDCGAINKEGKLSDVTCNAHSYAFICEIDYI